MRWVAATLLLAGCEAFLTEKAHRCTDDTNGTSWICPGDLACSPAPQYCGAPDPNVSACAAPKKEHDPCTTADTMVDGVCITQPDIGQRTCTPCTTDLEGCTYHGWNAMTPASATLHAIWVAGPEAAYTCGDSASLLKYDGVSWKSIALSIAAASGLTGVSGAAGGFVVVVGGGVAAHATNDVWSVDSVDTTYNLLAVWAASANDAFAVGGAGPGMNIIAHFDGSSWSPMVMGPGPLLYAVAGTSHSDVYAVGKGGIVMHFDGMTWSTIVPYSASGDDLYAAAASPTGDVFVAGGNVAGVIERYRGGSSQTATLPSSPTPIHSIWAGTGELYAGGAGSQLLSSTDGTTWTRMTKPMGAGSVTIQGIGADPMPPSGTHDVFAVGTGGVIWHYTQD